MRGRPGARRTLILASQVLFVGILLVLWELMPGDPRNGAVVDEFFSGRPTKIWQTVIKWLQSGLLANATWVTLQEAAVGFAVGSTSGIVLGFGLGASRILAAVFAPMVTALYTVPKLALIPMFILWFGIGTESKIAMVTLIVFFYAFFTSYGGATDVDEELIAVTRMMGASRWQVLLKVTFPSAVAWVVLGLQISVPHAFTGAIVAEMVAGQHGLGQLIRDAAGQFNPNGVFAGILAAVILSSTANGLVALGSRYLLRWRTTNEQETGAAAIA